MQQEINKDNRLRKKKAKTWTEAAKLVLDMYPKTPMGHKDIFNIIRSKGLKDVSGPASLACLNAMLHVHSKGSDAMFYRVAGSTSVFGLTSDIPEGAVRMEIEEDDTGMDTGNEDSDIESGHTTTQEQIIKERKGVLYVKLPSGFKSSPPQGINSNHYQGSIQNQQDGNSFGSSTTEVMLSVSESSRESDTADNITQNSTEETLVNGDSKDVENTQEMVSMERCPIRSISSSLQTSNIITTSPAKVSQSHSQRAIKHALRQQQKRRRRNTAIAASGTSTPGIPRIIMKPLPPPPNYNFNSDDKYRDCGNLEKRLEPVHKKPQTMRELLASIPGLSLKPRKRSNKKLSAAAQIAQTKKGCIDLETPDSILVNTNLRALLNKHTFASLPPLYQYRLVQLLPPIDHVIGPEYSVRLSASALSNEFFARSCQEWRERLAEGEFTPENQQKLKAEAEREHSKLDPWKIKYFEPVWGQKPTSDFPEQGKSSPFLIGASPLKSSLTTPSKHVPTIKIKQLVKKNRLVPAILKHRSSVGVSSSNNYQVSSNLNAVSHSKLACSVSDGTSNESSSHKRPLKITIDSSSLTCNKKIKPSSGFTTNPVITTVTASVTATETTENILQSNTTQSTSEQEQESNIIVQEAANSSSKPKIIPRPAGSDELYIAEDEVQDEIAEIHSSEKENSNESTTILMESAKEDEEISNDLITTEDNCCKNSSSGCDSLESIQDADQETKEENFCQEKIEEQQCDTPISLSSVETRWRPSSAPPTLVSKDNSSDETYLLPNIKKFNSYQDIFSKQMNSVVQSNNCLSRPLSQSFLVVGNTSCARFPGAGGNNSFGSISFSAGQLVKNGRNVVTLAGEMSHLEMRVATGLSNGLGMVFGQMPLHLGDCGVSASTGLVVNSQLLMSGFPLQHSGIAVNAPGLSQSSYPVTPGGILMTQDRTGFNNHLPLNDGHTPAVTMVAPLPIVSTGSIFPSVNGTTTVVTAPVQSSNMHGTTGRSPHALVNGVNSETASEGNSGGTIPPSDISGNNNCACNLKAMVMCRKCGAFCHDDCIGPSRLCVTCLIR